MTDRIYSCKSSPDGRHAVPPKGHICVHCHRSMTYLMDMGWRQHTPITPEMADLMGWNVIEGDHE